LGVWVRNDATPTPGGSIVKITGRILGLGVFLSLLGGCASYTHQVDLNSDDRLDTVRGNYTEGHYFYADFQLNQNVSRPDGAYEKRSLAQFRGKPDEIWFEDVDNDGDLDLRCRQSSKTRWDHIVDGEYVALNDGLGNFEELETMEGVAASFAAKR
jgi:hypothetical protein